MSNNASEYEKLGTFYLGRVYDLAARRRCEDALLYDSKDLVTHAVCVGMTGSGKTGLCLGLIEEAAIDGIPAIIIDPKGDLSNLLLTFPELRAEDFRPWINEDDARKAGVTPDEFARMQAEAWTKGLGGWGQDGARIRRLKESADFAIYTPGSSAGLPVCVLKSFDAPPREIVEDGELFRDRVSTTATSLLAFMGIQGEAIQSREHILLSNILGQVWGRGENLEIPAMIHHIQQPPFDKLGVMELETVYPAKDRFALAMALNNLVAAPGFSAWMEGEPLDIQAMLYTPHGKPRISIFSIAHLGEPERMFFVSLLLNQMLGWVRTQSGTSSLRAILYMDEIAGYVPPVENPPSKRPLLTLMKQARAYGVGVVLATQNPVDLDYKGLSNAGTWFIGRLQTERDKARVLDGLEGAAAAASATFDRAACDKAMSALGSRVFLMNNVHEDHPEIFETRWCLSYLRGPLTRQQIKTLMDTRRAGTKPEASAVSAVAAKGAESGGAASAVSVSAIPAKPANTATGRAVLPPDIPQYFIPARAADSILYVPMLLGLGKVYYSDAKAGVDLEQAAALITAITTGVVAVDWDAAEAVDIAASDLASQPAADARFAPLPAEAGRAKSYEAWRKGFADALFRVHRLEIQRSVTFKELSKPGEPERDFRARLAQVAREQRDAVAEKLRAKYAPRVATLQERLRRAEQQVAVQKEQASGAKLSTALSFGTALIGAFLGRKAVSAANIGRASTAARGVSRSMKETSDVSRAEETVEAVKQQLAEINLQFEAELNSATSRIDVASEELETISLKPKKTNITVKTVVLAWAPHTDRDGNTQPAW